MIGTTTFTSEQKEYLSGFFAGVNQRGGVNPFAGRLPSGQFTATSGDGVANLAEEETVYGTPIEDLCKEERIKYKQHGLDCYDRMIELGEKNELPGVDDTFRFKFYGLFNVKPAQDSFMLRCRIPGGVIKYHQLEGLAEIAEDWAGNYAHVTTRANFQLREIQPKNAIKVIEKLVDIGLTSRGSGADNLRNITGSSTAGFDPEELLDARPFASAMHHTILNTREFYNLPRKFNISFDGGGSISICADTNDIAFYAVRVAEGQGVEPGVYFRVQLAGITGHKQFAKDAGILIKPDQSIAVASAMVQVFIENGNRSQRNKSRLKYLIDDWGMEKFVEETEKQLDFDFRRFDLAKCEARRPVRRHGHLGVYPQKQEGLNYIGVSTPVGLMSPKQMKAIAALARQYGQGEIRLTVWQNLLIPHVKTENLDTVKQAIVEMGLDWKSNSVQGGLIACTGNQGCKFAAADTKRHALELGSYLQSEVELDQPLNMHFTGCPHSCAQHYVGDIGFQGAKVKVNGESVEGYHLVFGGGVDNEQGIAKEVFKSVPFSEVKPLVRKALEVYQAKRDDGESFVEFNRRFSEDELRSMYRIEEMAV